MLKAAHGAGTTLVPRAGGARRARAAALLLGAGSFLAAALTLSDPGITWDEPAYLESAKLELAWLGQAPKHLAAGSLATWVSADTLEAYWNADPYHNPHPPLYKVLAGVTWATFRPLLGEFPAFRLSSAALFGLLVAALGLWAAQAAGSLTAGVGAALALALMPRVFGDAHVGATDLPLTVFWALAAWFFWRAALCGRLWSMLLFGVFWGLALATKFNGLLVPVPLVAWALLHARRRLPQTLLVGGAVALILLVLLNPYLWPDPPGRYLAFIRETLSRIEWAPFRTLYLGRVYTFVLPWHHAAVLTLATVPLPLLVLAAAGAARLRDRGVRPLVSLCLLQVGFYQLLMALPSSPGHDGVRLFLPQFPFLALLAGLGFTAAWTLVGERAAPRPHARDGESRPLRNTWRMLAAQSVLAILMFAPPAAGLVRSHPLELAYFGEVVGGARGAYARGFESTYWFDAATPNFLRRIERELPPRARVWTHPAPWHFKALQRAGLLRDDLVFTDSLPAPFLLLMTRQGTFGPFHWRLHRFVSPLVTATYEGVPLMALYRWS